SFLQDLQRCAVAFVGVGPAEIPVVLVGGDLVPEVVRVAESLDVEELGFFVGMEAFDISVGVGVAADVAMLGREELLDGVGETAVGFVHGLAVELATTVGLNHYVLAVDAIAA